MMKSIARRTLDWLVAFGWVYFTCLVVWLGLYLLVGDGWWGLALVTSVAHLLFWPLPVVGVLAAVTRRRSLWIETGAAIVVWLVLFGGLFNFPTQAARAAEPTVRVMTYNVEYRNADVEAVAATIRAAEADVVGLQELTPALAASLGPALTDDYPYQLLDPKASVIGMGMLSRYPFEVVEMGDGLGDFWIGDPQVVEAALPVGHVMVANTHFSNGPNRDVNADRVARWVRLQAQPVVVLGDVNATDLSDAYRRLTAAGLRDAWREAGWGYGSTFPASGGVAYFGEVPIHFPGRLVRIDYVFHTPDLAPLSVERLPWDGASDHLAVAVEPGWVGDG